MKKNQDIIDSAISQEYEYGFTTDIEQETIPPGLNEDVIQIISAKKNEPDWLLDWRLKAYKQWLKMDEPDWSKLNYGNIDFQAISYYAAPKKKEPPEHNHSEHTALSKQALKFVDQRREDLQAVTHRLRSCQVDASAFQEIEWIL
mgnify:CR=1 FL=1